MSRDKEEPRRRIRDWLKQFSAWLTGLGGVVVLVYGAIAFVDSRVENAINDPRYTERLAQHVRPSVIFDDGGTVLADMGGMAFVSALTVDTTEVQYGVPSLRIRLTPTEHLATQPVVEALDGDFVVKAERGMMLDWIFSAEPVFALTAMDNPTVDSYRFRLEVLR